MVKLKLETSELLEYFNIHMIVLKLLLVHLTIYHQKFVKKNHITRNLIFGPLVAFSMKW